MDYKKVLNISVAVSVAGCAIGYLLVYFSERICGVEDDSFCIFSVGEPLLFGFVQLTIIFLILRFLPKEIFRAWLWFASWYIPLAIILIFVAPSTGSGIFPTDKESSTWTLGGIYMAVSILIISIRLIFLKLRKKIR